MRARAVTAGAHAGEFGAQASVLGKKVLLDGEPYVIIGVMPRGGFGCGSITTAASRR